MDNKDKKIIGYDNRGFPIYEESVAVNNNNGIDKSNKKKNRIMTVIKILIVLVLFNFLFVRCSCTKYHKIDSDKTILEKINKYITGERFELVSSEKFQRNPDGKRFKFHSLERDLNFEVTVTLEYGCAGFCEWVNTYNSTYYQEINKIYETQVLETIKKYYNNSQFIIRKSKSGGEYLEDYHESIEDEGIDIMIEINTKDDIDNYSKLVNDINFIYSAENKYNGILGVNVCAKEKIYEDDSCSGLDIYNADIDGKTTYSSDNIKDEIYQKIKEECIIIDGLNIGCIDKNIDDVYVNNHKMTYEEDNSYNVYLHNTSKISYFEGIHHKYYVTISDYFNKSILPQYLTVLGIKYEMEQSNGSDVKFEYAGKKYEIEVKSDSFKVIVNGKAINTFDYIKTDDGVFLSIDDFADMLGLTYEINNSVYFTSAY